MPNKHFCQGPNCHTHVTQDRFLKSRGVIRGRYAYADRDRTPNTWGYTPNGSDVYFCSQSCKFDWLSLNMENIEHGRPIEFIRHRRETQGYAKVKNEERWGAEYSIERVDNGQLIEQDYPINKERYIMDYENDYNLLEDWAEQQLWEDSVESYLEDMEDDNE